MEKREVYFDNSATTRAFDEVRDIVAETMTVDYGNTSSRHMKGVEAENYIKTAREEIAKTLKVKDKEILFTSGGTESNNLALIGTALANKRAETTSSPPAWNMHRSTIRQRFSRSLDSV